MAIASEYQESEVLHHDGNGLFVVNCVNRLVLITSSMLALAMKLLIPERYSSGVIRGVCCSTEGGGVFDVRH
ncbi:MAG: hypothetical protein WCI00_07160 [bacterium]